MRTILASIAVAAALLAIACAPKDASDAKFAIQMHALTPAQVSEVQISIVSNGPALTRDPTSKLGKTCIKDVVMNNRFVLLEDGKKSVLIDPAVTSDVKIEGITVGNDYLFVAEAISKDSPPRLIGHGQQTRSITLGETTPVSLDVSGNPDGGAFIDNCDPHF